MRTWAALPLTLLAVACAQVPSERVAPTTSGIEGTTVIGPMCPVETAASPCPNKPVATGIVVRDHVGGIVLRFQTGPNGEFKVALQAGKYVLEGDSADHLRLIQPRTVIVTPSQYTQVGEVVLDSGIR